MASALKVSKSRKQFMVFSILPKNEWKQFDLSYHSSKVKFFRSFFGRIEENISRFRDLLTFSKILGTICKTILRQFSGSRQAIIRQSSGNCQAVIKLSLIMQPRRVKAFSQTKYFMFNNSRTTLLLWTVWLEEKLQRCLKLRNFQNPFCHKLEILNYQKHSKSSKLNFFESLLNKDKSVGP